MITCDEPWIVDPWVRILEISSGTSCIVLSTVSSRGDIAYAVVRVAADSAHIPSGMSLLPGMIDQGM
ncbi:hypothetical protein SAV14893_036240 [Streptomyces avermitilis]|uniref:Uncharacterized protein n=1 Tax=Streptomyces avermitilis TaxID=33903 RepID=A0A4D4MX14_STRAX|nr:hypothetical protein SAVMC3_48230 [Streptomyces avermitilis]GDY64231.1 hypothetical protein SAV14893_036240 [Streptomyces avermitilis]GDY75607.1 hypothetical protein SAV31267_050920 [Streptomyces avermitilis]GDY84587.1 hypothetical protein SAVCW2_37860 [Streptomyces avermitilis]